MSEISITLAPPLLIKPIHEILLNVRENLYHYNGILIMCHYDVMSCTKVAVTAEAVQRVILLTKAVPCPDV